MVEQSIQLNFKLGVHSRPAALIVKKVREFPDSAIMLYHKDRQCAGNSLIGLLSLGIQRGDTIRITVEGGNEEAVLQEMADFFLNSANSEE